VTLTIFNVLRHSSLKNFSNPVFSSVSYKSVSNTCAQYVFTLKDEAKYYGYRVEYEDGAMTFSLKNPPSLDSGAAPLGGVTVLLDPGHGSDPGAMGPRGRLGPNEADINLSIALKARAILKDMGANVILTRSADTSVSLDSRVVQIKGSLADICISIHCNSMEPTVNYNDCKGLMVLYSARHSKATAEFFQRSLISGLSRSDMGARYQSLAVCRVTELPSILIETGFVSNPQEYEWLVSQAGQQELAQVLCDAVKAWVDQQQAQ